MYWTDIVLRKVYVEISNICNLSCSFCPGTKRMPGVMTVPQFETVARKLRGVTQYLYFHLMGEPLLHPELPHLLEIAEAEGYKVIITTNGTLLPRQEELLLGSGAVHKVNISLQSFEANAGGRLEAYVQGCAAFARKMGQRGKICVLRLWNSGGLESLNADIERILEKEFPKPWRESRASLALAERVWLEPGEKFDWPDMSELDRGESCFCYALRDQAGILCDGTVVPCCLDHEGDIPLGNIFEQSMEEILSSPRAKTMYDGFSRRRAVEELCRKCGYARRFNK